MSCLGVHFCDADAAFVLIVSLDCFVLAVVHVLPPLTLLILLIREL